MLGLGHEAFLREDVDGSGVQPILQGNETSLKCGQKQENSKNYIKSEKVVTKTKSRFLAKPRELEGF